MPDSGILTVYKLKTISDPGLKPVEMLTDGISAYYSDRTIGVTRAYAALGAGQQIDRLVRIYNCAPDADYQYAILEDGAQYRIELKQYTGDDTDLTLVRLGGLYDVYTE